MATRLPDTSAAAPAPPPAAAPAADEAEVLFPDAPLLIAGRQLLVREYRYGESLEVAALAAPLIADIAQTVAGGALRYDLVRPLFGRHRALVLQLVARAADVEPAWVAGLSRAQGELLVNTWFSVNSGFFVHEAAVILLERHRQAGASAGPTSSSASAAPASADSTASASAPSVN